MRRPITLIATAACALLLGGGIASAETQEVSGDRPGDITKMIATNGTDAVTARVFGLGAPCGGAKQLDVYLKSRTGKISYIAHGACVAGQEWHTELLYTPTGDIQDQQVVRCRNFEFTRIRSTGAYRTFMPRGCLDEAPNAIRVEAEGVNYGGSAFGGHAGPTRVLSRG